MLRYVSHRCLRELKTLKALVCLFFVSLVVLIRILPSKTSGHGGWPVINSHHGKDSGIQVAVAACGEEVRRKEELITLIKSCLIFTVPSSVVHFHVFASPPMWKYLTENVTSWPQAVQDKMILSHYKPEFPNDKWANMYRPCSTLRLFMPLFLPKSVPRVIYMDTDSIAIGPLSKLWDEFKEFGPETRFGMSLESVVENGWYDSHPEIPVPVEHGVNAGILLMDVSRIRADSDAWLETLDDIANDQTSSNKMGDQDILNQYLHMYPKQLHILPCSYNFRPQFCHKVSTEHTHGCPVAEEGVVILHGSNFTLHATSTIFHYFYKTFKDHNFRSSETLFTQFTNIDGMNNKLCSNFIDFFTMEAKEFFSSNYRL